MNKNLLIGILCVAIAAMAGTACKKKAGTIDNLKQAIIGETTASAKYMAYSKKAKDEKFDKIATLFEAASKAEGFHAKKHARVLRELGVVMDPIVPAFTVKTTRENLEDAIKGETHESETMYPGFIARAKEEGKDNAVTTFNFALQVEKKHLAFYTAALEALKKKDFKGLSDTYAVCPVCGNTYAAAVPANCEICGEPKSIFIIIK